VWIISRSPVFVNRKCRRKGQGIREKTLVRSRFPALSRIRSGAPFPALRFPAPNRRIAPVFPFVCIFLLNIHEILYFYSFLRSAAYFSPRGNLHSFRRIEAGKEVNL